MAMLQKEETLLKVLSKPQNSTFSSSLSKQIQKPVLSTHNKPITRTKSNSISIKAPIQTAETMSSPKSPKHTSPSPFAGKRNDQNLYSDRSSSFKSPVALKETKKASLMNLRPKKCETLQQPVQIPEPSAESLDRYTFYSSNFSLFDAKTPPAKSPHDIISGQNNLISAFDQMQDSKETPQLEMKTEPDEDTVNTRVLTTSKSCKAYDVPVDLQAGLKDVKIPLTSPKTTKHTVGSPVPISYTSKFSDSFSSRLSSKQDRNFSPLLKTQPTPKSGVAQHNTAQTYYLPGKKSSYEPKDVRILRSVSPTAAASAIGDGSPKKESKITNYINKNPFLQPNSTDYGKYDKLFKGIQSRGLGKFMPENYKKLGKSYTFENNAKTLRENRLLTSKSTMKGTRNMLGQYLSHREIQSFCDSSNNKTTTHEDQIDKAGHVEKEINVDHIEQPDNFENISNTISGAQTDNVTCTSVEQGGEFENSQKAKSGRQCSSSIKDSDVQDKDDITAMKRDSWIGKQKETFEEFFSSAMSYMCEVIVSKEAKSPKFDEKTHEEHLDVLLDHIISEILVLKKGFLELSERVRIGKSLLILLEMMLRSLVYLVRKDGNLKSTSRNRSNEKTIGKKDKSSRQDYKVKFEEICGLSGKEGLCEENERNVRDNLCYEIEKRREELDVLEKELKEGNQTRMLQYVQNIQAKISKVLKDRKR